MQNSVWFTFLALQMASKFRCTFIWAIPSIQIEIVNEVFDSGQEFTITQSWKNTESADLYSDEILN